MKGSGHNDRGPQKIEDFLGYQTGKLYVIGVGPGDPELLTLKALRILKEVPCLCVPKGREEGSSLALSIVEKAVNLNGKEIIEAHFPMRKTKTPSPLLDTKWQETVDTVYQRLNNGIDMAFITIGDPTIYSTFFYLYDKLLELKPELNIEIIPGVSSINASASKANISLALADEKIAILPANYVTGIEKILMEFDTVVLMKVNKTFDKISRLLDKLELTEKAVYVSCVGMDNERIFRNIKDIKKEDMSYFSILIIKREHICPK